MIQGFHSARILLASVFLCMLVTGIAGPVLARAQSSDAPYVLVVTVDGIINSVKERFISRALEQAQDEGSTAVIIQLDTPGGLLGPQVLGARRRGRDPYSGEKREAPLGADDRARAGPAAGPRVPGVDARLRR